MPMHDKTVFRERFLDLSGDSDEDPVPALMPEAAVDLLEMVSVREENI